MNKIKFLSITSKNFCSFGNTPITIDLTKENTLVCSNENGAGKSTGLTYALTYVLFDKAYQDGQKKTSLVNSTNNKDCLVEVTFESKGSLWLIRRGMKPNIFEIHKDGELYTNEASLRDPQKYLTESVLGFNDKVFFSIATLGVDQFTSFNNMTAAETRNFVDTLLDLGIFTSMSEVAKAGLKSLNTKIQDAEHTKEIKMTQVGGVARMVTLLEDNLAQFDIRKAADVGAKEATQLEATQTLNTLSEPIRAATLEVKELSVVALKEEAFRADMDKVLEYVKVSKQRWEYEKNVPPKTEEINGVMSQLSICETTLLETNKKQTEYLNAINENKALIKEEEERLNASNSYLIRAKELKRGFDRHVETLNASLVEFDAKCDCPACGQPISEGRKSEFKQDIDAKKVVARRNSEDIQKKIDAEQSNFVHISETLTYLKGKEFKHYDGEIGRLTAELLTLKTNKTALQSSIDLEESTNADRSVFLQQWLRDNTELATKYVRQLGDDSATMEQLSKVEQLTQEKKNQACHASLLLEEKTRALNSLLLQQKAAQSDVAKAQIALNNANAATSDEVKQKLDTEKSALDTLNRDITAMNEELSTWYVEKDNYAHLLSYLKEDGIKSIVAKEYLPFLNARVNEYLDALNLWVNLTFDAEFGITMSAPDRKNQTIAGLSTGQKRRIDIAILLAWRDIARQKASTDTNLLIMDETLENLSAQGVSDFVDMFSAKCKGVSLFVMTQRNIEFEEYFDNVLKFTLKDGFSCLTEE